MWKKLKGTVEPLTCHEGPEGEQSYSSTLSLTLLLDGCGWSAPGQAVQLTVQDAGWAPSSVGTGAKNFIPACVCFLVFSCTLFVLHPYLFLCLDCPAFCLLSFLTTHNTNLPAPGGIRTCNPSQRSAADPRLRQLGQWDRRIQSPDRPARGEWLYRLSYRGP